MHESNCRRQSDRAIGDALRLFAIFLAGMSNTLALRYQHRISRLPAVRPHLTFR